jgi:hypothetical protein
VAILVGDRGDRSVVAVLVVVDEGAQRWVAVEGGTAESGGRGDGGEGNRSAVADQIGVGALDRVQRVGWWSSGGGLRVGDQGVILGGVDASLAGFAVARLSASFTLRPRRR